jgi:hypothetical protein
MLSIPTAALLETWERGRDAWPGERGLILLALACPDVPVALLARWPVGQRDAALLGLFERLFGSRLAAQAECPRCNAAIEIDFPVAMISAPAPGPIPKRFILEHAGYRVNYRLPTAGDLAALADPALGSGDAETRSRWLLQQCVLRVGERDQSEVQDDGGLELSSKQDNAKLGDIASARDIPDEVMGALEASIASTAASVDPLAEIELKLDCPECAFSWQSPFDIVSFLWSELDVWAKQMLREIHILASNYGWSEADIIALSPQRRQHYRGLIGL